MEEETVVDENNLESLSKEELIDLVKKLARNKRKRADSNQPKAKKVQHDSLNKSIEDIKIDPITGIINHQPNLITKDKPKSKKKEARELDFSKYSIRHIALKIAYLGWDYKGFASQADTDETIEGQLFHALEKTKLITSRDEANYSRCGRTDKGVSALSQVVSLHVRSNLIEGEGIVSTPTTPAPAKQKKNVQEINYVKAINSALPENIRVLAWAPVPTHFDARFSTLYRTYKYFFVKENLNIERMREAVQHFLGGEHDFRNFCKMDMGVTNFKREIFTFTIEPVSEIKRYYSINLSQLNFSDSEFYQLYCFTLSGKAFLWHQVRCMTAVLFLVGQGLEKPEIVKELLNIEANPRKPAYDFASELPLILWDCGYEDIQWIYELEHHPFQFKHYFQLWNQNIIKSCLVHLSLQHLENTLFKTNNSYTPYKQLPKPTKTEKYTPLSRRPKLDTFEEKQQVFEKKKAKKDVMMSHDD